MDNNNIEEKFLKLCRASKTGISDKDFRNAFPQVSTEDIVSTINHLISRGCIGILRGPDGLVYEFRESQSDPESQILDGDENIVYQSIKSADNRGIWTKDLKSRTNLHQTVITKVLRNLESRKIIKSVKSVKNSTRKVYMLYHLQPSTDITGGPWFSENELDVEFIEELSKITHRYILSKSISQKYGHILPHDYNGLPNAESVLEFIMNSGVISAELTIEDILMILSRLELDGLIEKVTSGMEMQSRIIADDEDDNIYVYRAALPVPFGLSHIGKVPCGVCPVFSSCSDSGPITPSKCPYYLDWIKF